MGTRTLSEKQERFLMDAYIEIEKEFNRGTTYVYQWNLVKELHFINAVLSEREYSIHEDADRLNSLRNLYSYIKNNQHV